MSCARHHRRDEQAVLEWRGLLECGELLERHDRVTRDVPHGRDAANGEEDEEPRFPNQAAWDGRIVAGSVCHNGGSSYQVSARPA